MTSRQILLWMLVVMAVWLLPVMSYVFGCRKEKNGLLPFFKKDKRDAVVEKTKMRDVFKGVAYITSQPSSPQLTAQFKGLPDFVTSTWNGTLTSERADFRDAIDNRSIASQIIDGENTFDITSALKSEIVGGTCNLNVSVNGKSTDYSFRIRGKNPLDATARAYIDANVDAEFRSYAWMIAKHESKSGSRVYNQFNPFGAKIELPNKGDKTNNFGWGMCQIDKGRTGTSTAEVYNWHQSVTSMNAKLRTALSDYNRFVGFYRDLYANDQTTHWIEPDNVTTQVAGYTVSAKVWSILTFYNGAYGCPRRMLSGKTRTVPLEFIPSTSSWVLYPNINDYVPKVMSDRNQAETE